MKKAAILILILASLCGGVFAQPAITSTPTPMVTGGAALLHYSGQILDYQHGFLFFTTGDGYRVSPTLRILDAKSNAATDRLPVTRLYARATFDATGQVVEIALSLKPLVSEATYDQVKQFAVSQTTKQTSPDLAKKKGGIEGKPVLVTFIVTVPPNTPLTDQIYIATDKSGWQPNAIRMDRIDALRYRYTAKLLSGTELDYLFTRGTWTTVERGENGLEQRPHHFFIANLDTANRTNQVYYWADQGASGGAPSAQATFNPNALPTPFNPSPFTFPTPNFPPRPVKTPHA
ncbi:MAG: hypothetical protein M3N19_12430 [Candidatus Eremiobacteraeota bacterium]|nr:hypothetical protein [Candidatus Eremiobacteraeota bacterium]